MSAAGPTAPTLRAAPAAWVDRAQVALLLGVLTALPFVLGDQPTQLTSAEETGLLAPEGDPRKQVVLMGTYALSGLLLLRRASAAARGLGLAWALLLAWCVASVAWADDPMLAVRRSLALAGTVTAGVHAGATLRLEDAPRLMRAVVAAVLGASVLVAIALPAQGLDPEGRLRGVFAHKNALGTFAALGAIAVAATASARPT
ncbi:MAG TPA: hypothetical protein VEA81_09815, partial [Burkholderiaceae bacterium]|nr:hypothetical protein [Burkholderiaceae bacterium]